MEIRLVAHPTSGSEGEFFILTPQQHEIVQAPHTHIALYGPAASGKTTCIIERALHLIKQGINPNNILVLTYGRDRANELRDLILNRAGVDLFEPLVRTFHSLAFTIINEKIEIDDPGYVLLSGAEQDAAIKELLTAVDENGVLTSSVQWPESLQAAIKTQGFVSEMRDLISRATELGLTPEQLADKGKQMGEAWWSFASHFFAEYRSVNNLRWSTPHDERMRIDPSAVVAEAVYALSINSELRKRFSDRYTHILVDDFQESDRSQRELLSQLTPLHLFISSDIDSTTGRFRGADPEGLTAYLSEFHQFTLTTQLSMATAISQLDAAITSKLRGFAPGRPQGKPVSPNSDDQISAQSQEGGAPQHEVLFGHLTSESEAAQYIAQEFKNAFLNDNTPWSQMAVVLRSPSSIPAFVRACEYHQVPLAFDNSSISLAQNPAVIPLLAIARFAIFPSSLNENNWSDLENILRSEYCGADSISLRGMRVATAEYLSRFHADDEIKPSTSDFLISQIKNSDPGVSAEIFADPRFESISRFARLYKLARNTVNTGGDIYEILWSIWSNAQDDRGREIALHWRDLAIAGGHRSHKYDRDLDAIMFLFQSAIRYITRLPGSRPIDFIEHIEKQSINSDAIVAQAVREEVVTVTTVHSTHGKHWKVVGLLGLQEGEWPNLRARSSLLGSERLMESSRTGLFKRQEIEAAQASALIQDERRLLHVAISRAQERLILACYSTESSHPSSYVDEIVEHLFGCELDELPITNLKRAITPHSVIAELRSLLSPSDKDDVSSEDRGVVLQTLKALNARGFVEANPENWIGAREISTEEGIAGPDDEIFISPSALDSFKRCSFRWLLEKNGGNDGSSSQQLVGTSLHALAADLINNPERSLDEFAEILTSNWSLISQSSGWHSEFEKRQAIERFSHFLTWHEWATDIQNRTLIGTEIDIKLVVGRAILNGSVDRVERDADGKIHIIDVKSGAKWEGKEIANSLQLRAYQLAIHENAFMNDEDKQRFEGELANPSFVFIKDSYAKPASYEVEQALMRESERDEFVGELQEVAQTMAGNKFTASSNKMCSNCELKSSCPLFPEGRWVVS